MNESLSSSESDCEEAERSRSCTRGGWCQDESQNVVILSVVVVTGLGMFMCMYVEQWDLITSAYFIMQIITTVGYGDVTPDKAVTRVFMAFYAIACLVVLAYLLNRLMEKVSQMQSDALRKNLRQVEAKLSKRVLADPSKVDEFAAYNKVIASSVIFLTFIAFGTIFYRLKEPCSCSFGLSKTANCDRTSAETCAATGGYVKTWTSSFYMSVITLSTVGFGDYSPKTRLGRIVAIFWMLFGVAACGSFVQALSELFFERSEDNRCQERFEHEEALSEEALSSSGGMDASGDGVLTAAEFRNYMLLKHGLVTRDTLDLIDEQFALLCPEGKDCVSMDYLRELSIRRGATKK
mmetsp:Transcript_34658/g.73820  ORF Transcript_34658/g.73820 Transcript_34658/m.73820 type:complete len:350 (-) Transcript_34658:97-1146(-)